METTRYNFQEYWKEGCTGLRDSNSSLHLEHILCPSDPPLFLNWNRDVMLEVVQPSCDYKLTSALV